MCWTVLDSGASSASSCLTCGSTVAAAVVAAHPLHLPHDGSGQLLDDVVLSFVLVSFKGLVQCLLFTVLQHRHPAANKKPSDDVPIMDTGGSDSADLHLTLSFVLGLEVIRSVVWRKTGNETLVGKDAVFELVGRESEAYGRTGRSSSSPLDSSSPGR